MNDKTEVHVSAEEIFEETSDYPESIDVEASVHSEAPVEGTKDFKNPQRKSEFNTTMDLNVKKIDKNDNNTWEKIYEKTDEPYFGEVKLFSKEFLDHIKRNPNTPQNIPY